MNKKLIEELKIDISKKGDYLPVTGEMTCITMGDKKIAEPVKVEHRIIDEFGRKSEWAEICKKDLAHYYPAIVNGAERIDGGQGSIIEFRNLYTAPQPTSEEEKDAARAEGRAEAVAIILALGPEDANISNLRKMLLGIGILEITTSI